MGVQFLTRVCQGAGPTLPQVWSRCKSRYFHNDPFTSQPNGRSWNQESPESDITPPKDGTRVPQSSKAVKGVFSQILMPCCRVGGTGCPPASPCCGPRRNCPPRVIGSLQDCRAELHSHRLPSGWCHASFMGLSNCSRAVTTYATEWIASDRPKKRV